MSQKKNNIEIDNNPMNISKLAILDLIDKSLSDAGVSNKLKGTLVNRIQTGLETYPGDSIEQEFAYELIYSFRHLLQYGMDHFGARPGRKFEPVDIETFVCSSSYMGQKEFVRPAIMGELKRLFEPMPHLFHEVILGGAIGIGKNFFTDMAMAYIIYDLSSYYSPQLEFGLAPGSSIVFMMQSASIKLARSVMYSQFRSRILLCPYFNKEFIPDKRIKTELRFPDNIIVVPLSSTDTAALGLNIYGGAQDEMSFLSVIKNSKKAGRQGIYDQAETLYNTVLRRMESRFMILGKIPGKLFLIGSANYPGNFIDKKIEKTRLRVLAGENVSTFVMSMAQWESLPKSRYSGETFRVELPNENTRGRILEPTDTPVADAEVKNVPIEHKASFEADFEGALRDIAGIAIGSISKFIRNVDRISLAAKKHDDMFGGRQLFISDEIDQRTVSNVKDMVDMEYLTDYMDPHTMIGAHIDLALTGDSVGIALGRVFGFVKSKSADPNRDTEETLPIFCADGATSIKPPPNSEINLFMIRDLIVFLKEHINIVFATLDSYESAMMMQSFRANRISSSVQSVDRSPQPYLDLKSAILSERILLPNNTILLGELRNLLRDPQTGKIDHPPGGNKDIADCVAGITYNFLHRRSSYRAGGSKGRPKVGTSRPKGSNRPQGKEGSRRIRTDEKGRLI